MALRHLLLEHNLIVMSAYDGVLRFLDLPRRMDDRQHLPSFSTANLHYTALAKLLISTVVVPIVPCPEAHSEGDGVVPANHGCVGVAQGIKGLVM